MTVTATNPNPYPVGLGLEVSSTSWNKVPAGGLLIVPPGGENTTKVTEEFGNSTDQIYASYDTCSVNSETE